MSKRGLFGLSGASGNTFWGAAAGAGIGTLAAVATEEFTDQDKHAELIGFGAASVAGAAMVAFPQTRSAGWAAIAVAALNHLPRVAQAFFSNKKIVKNAAGEAVTQQTATAPTNGLRLDNVPALRGLRLDTVPALKRGLQGLRLDTVPAVNGLSAPPQLLGPMHQPTLMRGSYVMGRGRR
jgi:hypothetical protein